MTTKACFLAVALAGISICFPAEAQVRSGTGSSGAVSSTTQHSTQLARHVTRALSSSAKNTSVSPAVSRKANLIQTSPNVQAPSAFVPFANSSLFDGASGVPGLGFDFPHLAAMRTGLANRVPPRFGPNGHPGPNSFSSILFWGYPYYDDSGSEQSEQLEAPQPQPENMVQQPVPEQQSADAGPDTGSVSATPDEAPADLPVPDVGNFILVRRDGRILFASIFSVVGSQLHYVTPEGIRRTLDLSDLDAGATQQMNEARGTTVQIHN